MYTLIQIIQIYKYTCVCEMYVYLEAIESHFSEYI